MWYEEHYVIVTLRIVKHYEQRIKNKNKDQALHIITYVIICRLRTHCIREYEKIV